MQSAKSQDPAVYLVQPAGDSDDAIIAHAIAILENRMAPITGRDVFVAPGAVKQYLQLKLAPYPYEVFGVMFLDVQNRLIEFREMFRGTVTQTAVYPREVLREALELGASGVVLTHNHPSGSTAPSRADEALTQTLKAALSLIDVRVLDHVIVGAGEPFSMAERGLV